MKDERIQATINRIAAGGCFLWYAFTLIAFNYRLWVLKQHPREFWDFFAIFLIVSLYGFIAFASKGAFDQRFKKTWLTIGITVIVGNTALFFIMGQIHSIAELGAFLLGIIPSVGLVIAVTYFLNRRWKRKEGIEDEK